MRLKEKAAAVIKDIVAHTGLLFDFLQYCCPFVKKFTLLKNELVKRKISEMDQQGKNIYKVLDFGCATGHISKLFDKDAYIGIDIDKRYIDFAKRKYPNKHFLFVEKNALPFPDAYFDLVLSLSTVHHISDEDIVIVLREICRVLKRGGSFVIYDGPPADLHTDPIVRFILNWDAGKHHRDRQTLFKLVEKNFNIRIFEEEEAGGYITYFMDLEKKEMGK